MYRLARGGNPTHVLLCISCRDAIWHKETQEVINSSLPNEQTRVAEGGGVAFFFFKDRRPRVRRNHAKRDVLARDGMDSWEGTGPDLCVVFPPPPRANFMNRL